MTTTVVTPGRLVRVEPGKVDERDVLELAEALIDEHGHTKMDSGSEERGWSIHGAIGESAKRITGAGDKGNDQPRKLRERAKARFESHHNKGRDPQTQPVTEYTANDDPAVGKDEAIALIREAREAVPA